MSKVVQRIMPLPSVFHEHPEAALSALQVMWNTAVGDPIPDTARPWSICFRCAQPWGAEVWPVMLLVTEMLEDRMVIIFGVCGQCRDQGRPAMQDALRLAAERWPAAGEASAATAFGNARSPVGLSTGTGQPRPCSSV